MFSNIKFVGNPSNGNITDLCGQMNRWTWWS